MKIPTILLAAALSLSAVASATADTLRLPAIIGDNMVLQRDMDLPLWGWDKPGTKVDLKVAGQTVRGTADKDGRWEVKLKPLSLQDTALRIEISTSNNEKRVLTNVLVGEVWICSGQSNMQWSVSSSYDSDLEQLLANYPEIRLISVPQVGTQELQDDFEGQWEPATPETVPAFSAVGYFFGRDLHQTLGVPVGLIDNAWGGSAAEAWVRRDLLEKDARFKRYMDDWKKTEAGYDYEKVMAAYQETYTKWKANAEKLKAEGKPAGNPPRRPSNAMTGQHRPGNLYAGVLNPLIPYGIRGAIWYQGESNSGRAKDYADLFPFMIQNWRDSWKQGNFPFYWVQLADYQSETDVPGDSNWAELRESQTKTLSLPNTGEAVIYDVGEGRDIHPRDKQTVGRRLARIALAQEYGFAVIYKGPKYQKMETKGDKISLQFENTEGGLYSFDTTTPQGFTIAGEDQVFYEADAKIVGTDRVEVSSDKVEKPVAVRYAWAQNPIATMQSKANRLPMTPFRTDNWTMITDLEAQDAARKAEEAKAAAEAAKAKAEAEATAKKAAAAKAKAAADATAKKAAEAAPKKEAAQ